VLSLHNSFSINRLKDIHGYSLLEFLNYFISRDKFVDKGGIQSDLIVLHYKFNSNNFAPKPQILTPIVNNQNQSNTPTQQTTKDEALLPLYPQLQKLSIIEKGKLLREKRQNQNPEQADESEKVSSEWPLPKEERLGERFDEEELTPQKFSQLLVGGRGGGNI
jgi:hypothetical protein